jgi:hypothetical protein
MRLLSTCLAPCVAIFLSTGCARPTADVSPPGYLYEVRGEDGSSNKGMAEQLDVTAGKNRLQIKDGKVTANGKAYGAIKRGDSVLLDRDGKLSVNGEQRSSE